MIFEQFHKLHMAIGSWELHILFLLGLALFGGSIGGRLFQKFKIPQVVGYLIIGFLVGHHGLNIVTTDIIAMLQPFNYFALGLIGFMIGGELKKEVFRKYGKQFFLILTSEAFGAFLFVFLFIGVLGSTFFGGNKFFWELGLLLGAIASATAPAATTDVLWEMKSRGPLTTTVLGIIALDDAVSLLLFAIASSIVSKMLGRTAGTGLLFILQPLYEIGVSISMGAILGWILSRILIREQIQMERILILSIATVMLVLGLALMIKVDVLLASMALGCVLANSIPRISKDVFRVVSGFTPPIYVLFFVLVGAKLNLGHLNATMALLLALYVAGRSAGKMIGATFGARISQAAPAVRNYLRYCLFSQAGVAIALTMVVSEVYPGPLANTVVAVIAISTFIVQIIGPPSTRFAVVKGGEAGLNITDEDLIRQTSAADLMEQPPIIHKNTRLVDILNIFKASEYLYHPVVDENKKLLGVITVESIRQTFMESDLDPLLLADDLMEPVKDTAYTDDSMLEIKERIDKYNLKYVLVLTKQGNYAGTIEQSAINKFITTKMLELERKVAALA